VTATRLASGGRIDRSRPIAFSFDGRSFTGFAGDTLAAALLANDEMVIGRSFKLHRPRGVFGAGYEDANAMVARRAPRAATNQLATVLEIEPEAAYRSVNAWPSARGDVGAVAQLFARFLPAGFYYKTFMWPTWHLFEPFIRRAAGLGAAPGEGAWEPVSESRFWDCDLLVAGGGPAGLAAALVGGRAGACVLLVDDGAVLGGRLRDEAGPGADWVIAAERELATLSNVRILRRATAWSHLEHNLIAVVERAPADAPDLDFRNWKIRAAQVVVAAGAFERPIPFANNDLPGIMLASAAATYATRHAVLPGRSIAVFTNNDSAYGAAVTLAGAGAALRIVDSRPEIPVELRAAMSSRGIEVHAGAMIAKAHGNGRVAAIEIAGAGGGTRRIACDAVAVSGGWNPAFHLASQSREARSVWNDDLATFVASHESRRFRICGAAAGVFDAAGCIASGAVAAASCLATLGRAAPALPVPELDASFTARKVQPLWFVPPPHRTDKVFVDVSGDVTIADLGLALREGFDSIELVKRYTTAGMGVDQGKTGNVNVIAIVGALTGAAPANVGTTTFRPPFVPVEFGAIAGARSGARLYPWRHTPLTDWHIAAGAVMYEAGLRWQRPGFYPRAGEGWLQAATREARAVREAVGVYDGTPLGKFLLKGRGVPELLDLLYINDFARLAPRRGKYGVMLSDDGLVLDDGVTFRLDDSTWLLHSSTGAAERIQLHIETILGVHRPDLEVTMIPMTSAWVNATICGPRARDMVAAMAPDFDVARAALPFMGMVEGRVGGIPVRVFRVSWTGEASFELNTPARHGPELWERILSAGQAFGIMPVGSEANHILRVEAGYISTGHEVDGTSDAHDLGLGGMVSRTKADFIGKRAMEIRRRAEPVRCELVGLLPEDPARMVDEGAPITPGGARADQEGFVSACVRSVALSRTIALGLLRNGRSRIGETVHARIRDQIVPMQVVAPVFYDADRSRVKS
jgi:sarcosine oxidase subunit alpha